MIGWPTFGTDPLMEFNVMEVVPAAYPDVQLAEFEGPPQ
jgi:hypothetical protein